MKRDKWTPAGHHKLCDAHFKKDDYIWPEDADVGKKRLKPDAVPSVFEFPSHLAPRERKRKQPVNRKIPSPKKKKLVATSSHVTTNDHNYAACPTKKVHQLKAKIAAKNKIIKKLKARHFRQAKTLQSVIQQLVKAKFLQSQYTQFFTENFSDMTVELFKNEAKKPRKRRGFEI